MKESKLEEKNIGAILQKMVDDSPKTRAYFLEGTYLDPSYLNLVYKEKYPTKKQLDNLKKAKNLHEFLVKNHLVNEKELENINDEDIIVSGKAYDFDERFELLTEEFRIILDEKTKDLEQKLLNKLNKIEKKIDIKD